MSKKTIILKIIIPTIIILCGVAIMFILVKKRPEPRREVRDNPGILVRLLKAVRQDTRILVKTTGTVHAAQEISVIPQVSGRVNYISPQLVAGGFFKKGEVLFQIEDIDYILALERAKAAKIKAEYELATIESRAHVARIEWERINKNPKTPPNPLVIYEPQLKSARATLTSASAAVEQAKINLQRTKVKAPFNARIRSENIDFGQYIRPGSSVAVLAGTNTAEIIVPLALNDLRWLNIPQSGTKIKGSEAIILVNNASESIAWQGYIVRSSGEVDPRTRMMQIVIEVNDPYGLKEAKQQSQPLLSIGTFVNVHIKGKMLKNVFIIPRTAFRDNSTVWIMDSKNKLRIKKVVPIRIEKEEVIISKGIDDGDMIILTNISGAANGMKLRAIKDQK